MRNVIWSWAEYVDNSFSALYSQGFTDVHQHIRPVIYSWFYIELEEDRLEEDRKVGIEDSSVE
jgi:hypothetical protein